MADAARLARYNAKRDFAKTPEPAGKVASSGKSLFIVQKHAATRLHWDFRLELDGVLLSWAVTRGPSANPEDKRLAVRTEDHPLSYATFEGTIPKGEYGGGTVMLWDRGTWEPHPGKDPTKTLEEGHLHFTLHGERMRGEWILIRLKPRAGEKGENWLLRKVAGEGEGADLAAEHMTSISSGRTMEDIASGKGAANAPPARRTATRKGAEKPPAFRAPMLATLADTPPAGREWLHEVKFDGYRLVVAVGGGKVECGTRNGNVFAPPSLAPLVAELQRLPGTALLDGEVCVLDHHGRPHFSMLKNSLKEGSAALDLFLFDVLELDGESLSALPLTERKARLRELLAPLKPPIHYTDHVCGEGEKVLAALCGKGFEGIISKRADSRYMPGKRGRTWLKIKCGRRQEFVIGGWSRSEKGRGFASLLLGYWRGDEFVYAGRVGTGFSNADIAELAARMEPLRLGEPAFAAVPREARRGATFVRPELVGEVAYTELTPDGHLRHPSFLGLREDKPAREVVLEQPAHEAPSAPAKAAGKARKAAPPELPVKLTNPDRVVFPEIGVTKRALADYYLAVAGLMLAEIGARPLSLVRCPQGRGKQCFFQKHDSGMFPHTVRKVDLAEKYGAPEPYMFLDSPEGLIGLVQMGVLEVHIWGSHVATVEQPDRLVFDLDPDEGLGFDAVIAGAQDVRTRLKRLGLESWAMLTGGKGIHIVLPIRPEQDWDAAKAWCAGFARGMAADAPDRYTATLSKRARAGRIFIDYLRNGRGQTAIAPYSTRAREGAPVAAPIAWSELGRLKPGAFRVTDAALLLKRAARLRGWARSDQSLPKLKP